MLIVSETTKRSPQQHGMAWAGITVGGRHFLGKHLDSRQELVVSSSLQWDRKTHNVVPVSSQALGEAEGI